MATDATPFTVKEGGLLQIGPLTMKIHSADGGVVKGEFTKTPTRARLKQERRARRKKEGK